MNLVELNKKLGKLGFNSTSAYELLIEINDYKIFVMPDKCDVSKSTINYGAEIKIWNKASTSFHQNESIVVLECVIRLLKIGYPPNKIELEKTWPSGRGQVIARQLPILIWMN